LRLPLYIKYICSSKTHITRASSKQQSVRERTNFVKALKKKKQGEILLKANTMKSS
jgi:hypothetical protein